MSTDRTLSSQGERDTIILAGSKSKTTHSYTAQPMISRAGFPIGKIALCFQEKDGKFGSKVAEIAEKLERDYGNIVLMASSSVKMTSESTLKWIDEVLLKASL